MVKYWGRHIQYWLSEIFHVNDGDKGIREKGYIRVITVQCVCVCARLRACGTCACPDLVFLLLSTLGIAEYL